ncbi:MAG: IPT/TIG domain-containing protein [Planctomycetota bacterium]
MTVRTSWWIGALSLLVVLALPRPGTATFPIFIQGVTVRWSGDDVPVSYVIQSSGSDDIADHSEDLAIELGFAAWESSSSSTIAFAEDLTANASRTDFGANDIHLIWFDETNASGFFPGASSTIAITPVSFSLATGFIVDADIVFNGDDHDFSTNKSPGTFDVQSIATHEIGHFLGLDHSGIGAATMFPFAATEITLPRALTLDDHAGAANLYPAGATTGSVSGTVRRSGDSSVVIGAHVVAINDDGVVVASTYSGSDGTFTISPIPADTYQIYAEPIDQPVTGANLSSDIGGSAQTNFATTFLGGNATPTSVAVTPGSSNAVGTLTVPATGPFNLTAATSQPVAAPRGNFAAITIFGTGLDGADETVSVSGTGVTLFWSSFTNGGNPRYSLILQILSTAEPGPRNITVSNAANEIAVLTGVVQVVEPSPTISMVTPSFGSSGGGTAVTITGTNFVTGMTVFFGDTLATAVSVDSATQITCTSPSGGSGAVDVIVQNPEGNIAVASDGYEYEGLPTVTSVFPGAGDVAGGTTITITGSGFEAGVSVTIGGAPATVGSTSATSISCVSPAGVLGAQTLRVTNPLGLFDQSRTFTYVAIADPTINAVDPSTGSTSGGTEITVSGTGFQSGLTVLVGGVAATAVTLVSATTATAVTPAHAAGTVNVQVTNPDTTGATAAAAFTFEAPAAGGGGGGGGCGSTVGLPPGSDPFTGGSFPYLLLSLAALAHHFLRIRARKNERDFSPVSG